MFWESYFESSLLIKRWKYSAANGFPSSIRLLQKETQN